MRRAAWIVVAWIVLVAHGAATTGILRASLNARIDIAAWAFGSHQVFGGVVGLLAIIALLRSPSPRRWVAILLLSTAIVFGWLAARVLDPRMASAHGAFSAVAALAIFRALSGRAPLPIPASREGRGGRWIVFLARAAVFLVIVQVAIGAGLRHQLISIEWHLLFAGVAGLAALVPAVTIVNDPTAAVHSRRAARWTIAAIIVQVSLGALVFVMTLVGPPSVMAWLTITAAHVTVGTLTLLATAVFATAAGVPDPRTGLANESRD
jgi:hypothetical protein